MSKRDACSGLDESLYNYVLLNALKSEAKVADNQNNLREPFDGYHLRPGVDPVSLMNYWRWLCEPSHLEIDGVTPTLRTLFNYRGKTGYARLRYDDIEFRVIVSLVRNGGFSVRFADDMRPFEKVEHEHLMTKLESLLKQKLLVA